MLKKIKCLALFALLLTTTAVFAQSSGNGTTKQTEQYCLVVGTARLMSTKVNITVDYGQETKFFGDKGAIKDEAGNLQKFNSVIDALNYMNSQGWEFVNAYVISVGGQNVYHYLMRRHL